MGSASRALPLVAACIVGLPATAIASEQTLDDFEGAWSPAPWVLKVDPESPGAKGALSIGEGKEGKGAQLAFDFSAGGQFVAAELTLTVPVAAAALGLWVRSPPGIHVSLRVLDESGQTLQYDCARPLHATDPLAWYRIVVDLKSPTTPQEGGLQGGVTAVSLLAAKPLLPESAGVLEFDNVVVLDDVLFDLTSETLERVAVPATWPSLREVLGVNIHFAQDDYALDAAQQAGHRWARTNLYWSSVETKPGIYDFSSFDLLVQSLEARQMKAHFVLGYDNPLYSEGPGYAPQSPEAVEAFGKYAQAAAQHYAGKGVRFEVWNEANSAASWAPAPDPKHYAALAKEAIPRIHLGDPQAQVSTSGLSGFDFPFLQECLALGCGNEAEAIAVQAYRKQAPETLSDELLLLRSMIATLPSAPVVWSTEWGYSTTWYGFAGLPAAQGRQANFALRESLTAWALGLPAHVYYDIRDDGVDPNEPEHNFGLLTHNNQPKPALLAFITLAELTAQRTLAGFRVAAPTALHVLEMPGPQDVAFALWLSETDAQTRVRIPAHAEVQDLFGASIPLDAEHQFLLKESEGPAFVLVPHVPEAGAQDAVQEGADSADAPADAWGDSGAVSQSPLSPEGGCSCGTPRNCATRDSLTTLFLAVAIGSRLLNRRADQVRARARRLSNCL